MSNPERGQRRRPAASAAAGPVRIAKALARAGLCSRREAERWIAQGRVSVNGEVLSSPARDVSATDRILVDGNPLPAAEPPHLWRYHKPRGVVTTHADPQGRPTVFDALPAHLPRVVSIGRLDFNTEGLLLLTNDGALARHLELPATGWMRRYRVRAHGSIAQAGLDRLKGGIELAGVRYGPIEATLDKTQGSNVWLTVGLREGKNREVRKILEHLGLTVNRLIRISFGPFQLLDLEPGGVEPVRRRVLIDQLGARTAAELGLADLDGAGTRTRRHRSGKPPTPLHKD
jgi:23S rRNA pseudouridine2605 synthase